jgi:hypothetical protein
LADPTDARGRYALAKNLLGLGNIQARGNPDHALRSYQDGIAILAPMVAADPEDWLMERTLANLYSAAGLATRQFAGNGDVEQITRLRTQACSFFLEDAALWNDIGRRNVLIEVDRPKFEAAARWQRECGTPRGGRPTGD